MDAALVIYTLNSSTIFGVNFDSIFFSLSFFFSASVQSIKSGNLSTNKKAERQQQQQQRRRQQQQRRRQQQQQQHRQQIKPRHN